MVGRGQRSLVAAIDVVRGALQEQENVFLPELSRSSSSSRSKSRSSSVGGVSWSGQRAKASDCQFSGFFFWSFSFSLRCSFLIFSMLGRSLPFLPIPLSTSHFPRLPANWPRPTAGMEKILRTDQAVFLDYVSDTIRIRYHSTRPSCLSAQVQITRQTGKIPAEISRYQTRKTVSFLLVLFSYGVLFMYRLMSC